MGCGCMGFHFTLDIHVLWTLLDIWYISQCNMKTNKACILLSHFPNSSLNVCSFSDISEHFYVSGTVLRAKDEKETFIIASALKKKFNGEDWQVKKTLQIGMILISIEVMCKDLAQRKKYIFVGRRGGWDIVRQRRTREGSIIREILLEVTVKLDQKRY